MEEYNFKYAINHLSKKAKLILSAGTFAIVIGTAVGCGALSNDDSKEQQIESTEAATEATTEAAVTGAAPENNAEDKYSDEYEIINNMETDIVDFAKESLPNGFIEVNEENKVERAEMFTDSYMMLNLSSDKTQINPETIMVLNQDNVLVPRKVIENFMSFALYCGKYSQIVEPNTKFDFETIVQEQDDAKFLNDLEEEIAQMNVAKTKEERQKRIDNIIAIRDGLLTDAAAPTYKASTIYVAINMIIQADATARAYGDEIFPDSEEKTQLYTTFFDGYCDELVIAGYLTEEEAREYKEAGALSASPSSLESKYLTVSADMFKDVIQTYINNGETINAEYAYNPVTIRIAEQIFNLYKAPEMDNIAKENAIREQASKANTPAIGSSTSKEVSPNEVPDDQKEPSTTSENHDDNQSTEDADKIDDAQNSSSVFIKAKGAGITDGSVAAQNDYTSSYLGNAAGMPKKSVPAYPGDNCKDYNTIYNYFFAVTYNSSVDSFIAAEAKAREENEQATTEFQPADEQTTEQTSESTETITEATTEATTQATTQATTEAPTTEFVPVDDAPEEKIDEKIETISKRQTIINKYYALRQAIVGYISAYSDDIAEKCNIKRG